VAEKDRPKVLKKAAKASPGVKKIMSEDEKKV
jgi:hypothetical protein